MVTYTLAIIVGIAAVIVIGLLLWHGSKKKSSDEFTGNVDDAGNTPVATDATAATPPSASDGLPSHHLVSNAEAAIRAILAAGHKIEAIKRVREETGLGLKEAKDLVEAMERGAPVSIHAPVPARAYHGDLDREAKMLVAAGRKIEAIKLVREQKNLGLAEAKDYVERL